MALVKIVVLKTVYAPSALGAVPAFVGDSLSVDEETASELIESGHAQMEGSAPEVVVEEAPAEVVPEPEPEPVAEAVAVADPEPVAEAQPEEALTDAAKERLRR